jgi:hypothetical protein
MKNITKIIFAMILSLSVVQFANAGELSVTGSVQATYTKTSSDSTAAKVNKVPGIGMSNELAFNANGDFGTGYTWKYQVELDPNTRDGSAINDDTRLELGTPYGTVGIYNSEGDLNTHLKSSRAAYAPGHDIGTSGGYEGGTGINSYSNLQYHTPAGLLPNDISIKAAYSYGDGYGGDANDAGDTTIAPKPAVSYQISGAPVDGAKLGASYLKKKNSGLAVAATRGNTDVTLQDYETGGLYGTYDIGSFSIGAGRHWVAPNVTAGNGGTCAATTAVKSSSVAVSSTTGLPVTTNSYCAGLRYFQNDAYSVAFQVNPQLSISVDNMTSTAEIRNRLTSSTANTNLDTSRDLEVQSIQAAYNVGGAVVAIGRKSIEGVNYAQGTDQNETVLSLKMEF